jgi:outer membrane protein assembly factor BamE (lipoprotein component of BamABCDE complex)
MKKFGFSKVCFIGLLAFSLFICITACQKEQTPPPAATAPAPVPAPAPLAQPAAPPAAGTAPAGTAQPGTTVNPAQAVNQVQMGMTPDQVQKIMGAPTQTKQKGTKVEWEYLTPQGKVEIEFQNNQVSSIERH